MPSLNDLFNKVKQATPSLEDIFGVAKQGGNTLEDLFAQGSNKPQNSPPEH